MTRGAWLGLAVLAALLLYGGYDPGRSQPEPEPDDTWQERLDRLEEKLDLFLQERPTPPPRPTRRRRPAPPPTRRAPVIDTPIEAPTPPTTPADTPPADPTPPHRPRGWTWAEVDAWRAFRDLAQD